MDGNKSKDPETPRSDSSANADDTSSSSVGSIYKRISGITGKPVDVKEQPASSSDSDSDSDDSSAEKKKLKNSNSMFFYILAFSIVPLLLSLNQITVKQYFLTSQ